MTKINDNFISKIIELYKNDQFTMEDIAKKLSLNVKTVKKYLLINNIPIIYKGNNCRKYLINERYFDSIDTFDKAYILGFIAADGCVTNKRGLASDKAKTISICLSSKDKDILEKIVPYLFLENPLSHIKHNIRKKLKKDGTIKSESYIRINSVNLINQLNNLGIEQRKSLTLQFPNFIKDCNLLPSFIRGYYDGDGGVYLNKKHCKIRIIGTEEFITDLNLLVLKKLKLKFRIYRAHSNINSFRNELSGFFNCRKFLDWIYKDNNNLFLNRKYMLYQQVLQRCKQIEDKRNTT